MSWILMNIFTKNVACVSAPLSDFFSPVTYPLLRLIWHRLQGHAVYNPWLSCSLRHCSILTLKATSFFPSVDAIVNLKSFGVLFDDKLAIIRL